MKGIATGTYISPEFTVNGYTVYFTATIRRMEYHTPGRMYMSNGDPGYPPEDDYDDPEIKSIDSVHVYDTEGIEVNDSVIPTQVLYDYFKDNFDEDNVEDWEYEDYDI